MHDINAGAQPATLEGRAFAPIGRLLDALLDPRRRTPTVAGLLLGFVALWTSYGLLAHGGVDVHADVAEAFEWSLDPSLQHHPPMMAWIYRVWFALFPQSDWSSYLLASTTVGITLWIVWLLLGDWLDDSKRIVGLALLTLTPLYTFHATKLNANTVMMPFWAATTLFFLRSVRTGARIDAALAGIAAAGAVLTKYWSLYLIAGLGVAALLNPERARYFRSSAPWVSIAIGIALLLPHALSLASHGRTIDFIVEETLRSNGFGAALVLSLKYYAGSLGYICIPLVALIAMRPSRAALTDIVVPMKAERQVVASLFWVPLLLPALVNLVLSHRLSPIWTIPNWSLLPIVLLGSPLVVIERRIALRILAFALALPVIAVLVAPAVSLINHRSGATDGNSRSSLVAQELVRSWRGATDRPLRWVAGAPLLVTLYYLPRTARILGLDGSPATAAAIIRDGVALACPVSESKCVAKIEAIGAAATGLRREVELARRYLGVEGRRVRYLIVIVAPPR